MREKLNDNDQAIDCDWDVQAMRGKRRKCISVSTSLNQSKLLGGAIPKSL
ncbi:hypothetical protein EMIT053CA3_240018 [Pseudomonas donghuensis]